MSLGNPIPGAGWVAEYLVPGVPWVTGAQVSSAATQEYEFPWVTSRVVVRNLSSSAGTLAVGFTAAGVAGTNRITLAPGSREEMFIRTKQLYVRGLGGTCSYEILAPLTRITGSQFPSYRAGDGGGLY